MASASGSVYAAVFNRSEDFPKTGKLDTSLMGLPVEPYGYSRDAQTIRETAQP